MSGPYDYHHMSMPPMDTFDPNYHIYDQQYGNFQQISGPPTPHEGFAFWYRPEAHAQDNIYRDQSIFGRSMSMVPPMVPESSIKHRRTRSGCFTCRSRRVKCDEKRPTCERCRKGNRTCEFPANTSSSKRTKTSDPKNTTGEHTPDRLDTIKDEPESEEGYEEEEDQQSDMPPPSRPSHQKPRLDRTRSESLSKSSIQRPREQSMTSNASTDQLSPSNEDSNESDMSGRSPKSEPFFGPNQRWRNIKPSLKDEVQTYLNFQAEYMTHYHYLFKIDPMDFVHCELIELALSFEPLFNAVVAFAAYHYTVRKPQQDASFHDFWKYYCKSINSLRKYLESKKPRDDLVLLTVLQLATFEEYMGDWTNLVNHHKAAYGIIMNKYTKESVMETERGRKIFEWFTRLDVIAGLMAVRDVSMDKSWMVYAHDWFKKRIETEDDASLVLTMEYVTKGIGLAGHDIAHTFAQANADLEKPGFSFASVMEQVSKLEAQLQDLCRVIQKLNDPDLAGPVETDATPEEDGIFGMDVPLFRGHLWPLNFVWMDWYGIVVLLKNQTFLALKKAQSLGSTKEELQQYEAHASRVLPQLQKYAMTQCEIFNAVAQSPNAPNGATLSCYAALGLSAVFLPHDPTGKYMTWSRKQMASIERQGYVWPPQFRREMAKLWNDESIENWWLPNDEGNLPILSEIRAVVVDRIAAATEGPDDGRNDLREIKGLFERMRLDKTTTAVGHIDPRYVNSREGMAHAASMVSSPEDISSTGSVGGLSPNPILPEYPAKIRASRSRTNSRGALASSPHSGTSARIHDDRMDGISE